MLARERSFTSGRIFQNLEKIFDDPPSKSENISYPTMECSVVGDQWSPSRGAAHYKVHLINGERLIDASVFLANSRH